MSNKRILLTHLAGATLLLTSQTVFAIDPLKAVVTTSQAFVLDPGQTTLTRHVEIPNCGLGRFLFKGVVASPEINTNSGAGHDVNLGTWSVRIPTMQRALTNTDTSVPLHLYGNGYETASIKLIKGQATFDESDITPEIKRSLRVNVDLINYAGSAKHIFNVHITGRCRNAYFTAVPPGTE